MSNEDNLNQQQQAPVNLGQLFSDVSRTVSGFRNILGQADSANSDLQSNLKLPLSDSQQMPSSNNGQTYGSGSPLAGLFSGGSTCFKTCGMEDIQWAAKRAGELFMTLRTCAIIMTVFAAVVVILLSILVIYLTYKQYQQSLDYRSSESSCESSYSPTTIDNTVKSTTSESRRPFFTNVLFHRRSDKSEERKTAEQ